ncbi:MAG: SGNH/GDSL hydrolase family protein, partial [Candidatus Omnitrophica bacterium]|nr:SGNH/GDSL hydrolase family protein [Candidatus Omnitrophota bacterium]
ISVFEQIHNVLIKTSWYIQYLHSRSFKAQENTDYNKEMMALPQFNDNEQFFIIQEDSLFFKDGTFVGVAWQNTKRYLLAIKGLAEERNAKVVFLYIPLRNQMGILDSGADVPLEFRRPASTYLNELLEKFSQREEVGFLDMLPVFEANKDEELYYINGGTLTPKGHRLVAQELFEFLNAQENGGL